MFKFPFFKKNRPRSAASRSNPVWIISTLALLLIFGGFLVVSSHPNFSFDGRTSVFDALTSIISGASVNTKKPLTFSLPLTMIYNLSDEKQAQQMQLFVNSLTDPQKGLKSTSLQTNTLDYQGPEAQKIIAEVKATYLPVVFFDQTIEQHPQFQGLSQYLQKKDTRYFFQLEPFQHLQIPPTTTGHSRGADLTKAKVVILEYVSFTCHFCQQMEEVLSKILKELAGSVTVVTKNYDRGGADSMLAQGAECANDQGKYWEMHDQLFAQQEALSKNLATLKQDDPQVAQKFAAIVRTSLQTLAGTLRLNTKDFLSCLDSQKYAELVKTQTNEALDYGINGTPAFFVNKSFSDGASSYEDFKALVLNEMQQAP